MCCEDWGSARLWLRLWVLVWQCAFNVGCLLLRPSDTAVNTEPYGHFHEGPFRSRRRVDVRLMAGKLSRWRLGLSLMTYLHLDAGRSLAARAAPESAGDQISSTAHQELLVAQQQPQRSLSVAGELQPHHCPINLPKHLRNLPAPVL